MSAEMTLWEKFEKVAIETLENEFLGTCVKVQAWKIYYLARISGKTNVDLINGSRETNEDWLRQILLFTKSDVDRWERELEAK